MFLAIGIPSDITRTTDNSASQREEKANGCYVPVRKAKKKRSISAPERAGMDNYASEVQ